MPRIVRPDLFRFHGIEIGFPAGTATGRSIKPNKELPEISDEIETGQVKPAKALSDKRQTIFLQARPILG